MLVIGITGGIGSGKTVVCKLFQQLGVPVYNADNEAKKLMASDLVLIKMIKKKFGPEVYGSKDELNRKKLAEIVFKDKEALAKLNSIVHPAVRKHFKKWVTEHSDVPYVMKEAAILIESGASEDCNKIITVVAPNNLRIKRVVERDNVSKERVKSIIASQMSTSENVKKSDFVIHNDDSAMVIPQVLEMHENFLTLSKDF
ncbi:MAG: dephospho-CoA kinase [Bacteroidota bacterium]